MSLKDRMDRAGISAEDLEPDAKNGTEPSRNSVAPGRPPSPPRQTQSAPARPLSDLKLRAQNSLFVRLGHRLYDSAVGDDEMRALVKDELRSILADEEIPLTEEQHGRLVEEIAANALGLGPIEDLLEDDSVTEIMVLGDSPIFVEREGKIHRTKANFVSEDHLRRTIDRIVSQVGRRIDEASPMVDARLPDGSRINAVIPPLAVDGSMLTVRKFSRTPFSVTELIRFKTISAQIAAFLETAVKARITILISGGTGTGKTTFLNVLSGYVPHDERIVSIEDSIELQLRQTHVARLESRPPNIEGKGEVTIRDLVRNALRMRPDRIIVGEVRGGEALDMLQAMNTGHEGSLTTLHANTPRDALARIETMVLMAGMDLPHRAIREQISSAVNLIVQLSRLSDGTRRVTKICEVTGMEGDVIQLTDLFNFDWEAGVDPAGNFKGITQPTGLRPTFEKRINELGLELDPATFGSPLDADALAKVAAVIERRSSGLTLGITMLLAGLFAALFGASAAQGQVPELDIVETSSEGKEITVTVVAPPELRTSAADLESFVVEIDGEPAAVTVEMVAGDDLDVVLLVDVSGSMTPEALAAAKASGAAFVNQLPAQSRVAIVSFGDAATLVQPFTTSLTDVVATLESLEAEGETALHAAVVEAARQFDPTSDSLRTVVLLSDGGNTVAESSLGNAQAALLSSGATLHAISIETDEANPAELELLADATGGTVARVEQVEAIEALYRAIADELGNQYRLRFVAVGEGEVVATILARDEDQTLAQASLRLSLPVVLVAPTAVPSPTSVPDADAPAVAAPTRPETSTPAAATLDASSNSVLKWASIAAVAAAIAIIGMTLLTPGEQRQRRVKPSERFEVTPHQDKGSRVRWVVSRMTNTVENLISGRRLGAWVSNVLDIAGWKVRNSEFVVLVFLFAVVGFFAGAIWSFWLGIALVMGVLVSFTLLLSLMVSRRRSAFGDQLSGTLQMMAGALRTGYSLPQVISLVAEEAEAPTSEEFSRIAVEMRLGRDLVEAIRAVGNRMANPDFLWTTGAIDVARDVGGDLAEVLDNVGATVRTRERVRRQIQALSAEGRISAWILIGLPFPIFFWQLLVNRSYTMLLVNDGLGRLIFFSGVGLLIVGAFWLRNQIRIEY